MQRVIKQKTYLGPKRRVRRRLDPFSWSLPSPLCPLMPCPTFPAVGPLVGRWRRGDDVANP